MLSTFPWRGGLVARRMRAGLAWFVLVALAVPGFASMRGICCEPGLTRGSDCCAAAVKMPGMDSSQMAAMNESPGMESRLLDARFLAAPAECAMAPVEEAPEFLLKSESLQRDFLPGQDQTYALAGTRDAELVSSVAPPFFIYKTLPTVLRFDPLSVSLRI